jgi:hypothetical protein
MHLTRPKVIAITLLAVLVALGSASLAFAPEFETASIELTPILGCPGTRVSLYAHLPFSDGSVAAASIATGIAAIDGGPKLTITSYPDGLMSGEQFRVIENNGIEVDGQFVVSDSVCAGDYTVTVRLIEDTRTLDSVSAVFTVGGEGCPNLPSCLRPVGGVVMPANTLAITAPYLALAGLIAVVSAVIVVKRRD